MYRILNSETAMRGGGHDRTEFDGDGAKLK
jgi:hypothetical protein